MITISGPKAVSRSALSGPVCWTLGGTSGSINFRLAPPVPGVRYARTSVEPPTYCIWLPPGFTGTLRFRIGDANGTTPAYLVVTP